VARSAEATARDWVDWFNDGRLADPGEFYGERAELQRMGLQEPIRGPEAIAAFLQDEAAGIPGRRLRVMEAFEQDGHVAIEVFCEGLEGEAQRFDTPWYRLGPALILLRVGDGLITQDHTYLAAPPVALRPVGLEAITYLASPVELPALLEHWTSTYRNDPEAMMNECYTPDGTVEAMRLGGHPTAKEPQIAMEKRSAEVFPGHQIHMKRWLTGPGVIAVEFSWEGRHVRLPERNLQTISACYLRLREGRIAVDHTYIPTGSA
jgi:hypothetical protein